MIQIALQNLELANKFGISLQVVQSWFQGGFFNDIKSGEVFFEKNSVQFFQCLTVLVQSIIGFLEELLKVKDNTNDGYQKYITKTLDELLQAPLRDKTSKKN